MSSLILKASRRKRHLCAVAVLQLLGCAAAGCLAKEVDWKATLDASYQPIDTREFRPVVAEKWKGRGVGYGPYRVGQAPWGPLPTEEELAEDLQILTQHWDLIRVYGSVDPAEAILQTIQDKKLPLRVMLGAWITPEASQEGDPPGTAEAAKQANERQVKGAIRLANKYPDQVIAVNVGNETQVFWSDHKTTPDVLVNYIRQVRDAIKVPVTTADDFNYWNKPESKYVAREVDFIVTHVYAMWGGLDLDTAVPWTRKMYQEVCDMHPGKAVVLGEAGWATEVHSEGEQARLIKGKAGEAEQRVFVAEFLDWVVKDRICFFYFEAFDEPWKGGPHPDEVEKHWGLYRVDRTPKAAVQALKRATASRP